MNSEDITRMADEADLWADQELQCIGEYHPDWHEVRDMRFAALVAAAEREACASFIEHDYVRQFEKPWREDLSAAIRARGNT